VSRLTLGVAAGAVALALASPSLASSGRELYFANCVWCHGEGLLGVPLADGRTGPGGGTAAGPPLEGVGAAAVDFYLRTGYMPLRDARDQPVRKRPRFHEAGIGALVRFIGARGGPAVPDVDPGRGSLAQGLHVFTERCAGCHQIAGEGGILIGARVPSLKHASARQIAEAVRVGPYLMPRYSEHEISQRQLDSLVRYVLYVRDPDDRGGWALEHLGPVPEGIVAWLLAGAALLAVARVIGEGLKR
jgi:ubiquinol-cytochrome c reductase cytochrome c subunit